MQQGIGFMMPHYQEKRKRTMLRFDDGIEVDTEGPLRLLKLTDGYYVVGRGMLIPVNDTQEGIILIKELGRSKDRE